MSVSLYSADDVLAGMDSGKTYAGGLLTADADSSKWVLPDPEGALAMLMGGVIAERLVLGHQLENGFLVDMQKWNAGVESLCISDDDRREYVREARRVTEDFLSRNAGAHDAIVRALMTTGESATILKEADVKELLRSS